MAGLNNISPVHPDYPVTRLPGETVRHRVYSSIWYLWIHGFITLEQRQHAERKYVDWLDHHKNNSDAA